VDTKSFGVSHLAPIASLPTAAAHDAMPPTIDDNDSFSTQGHSALDELDEDSLDSALDASLESALGSADLLLPAPKPVEKKVRHNLIERQRVDRLNKLFYKLSVVLDEPDEQAAELMPPSEKPPKEEAPEPKSNGSKAFGVRSKAEVLEAALTTISELRKQLAEERLARCLGVANLASEISCAMDDDELDVGSSGAYENVSWSV